MQRNPFLLFKDCEHSIVQLTRPVRLRRTPFRSRQSLRASIIYKGPPLFVTQQSATDQAASTSPTQPSAAAESGSVNGALPHTEGDKGHGNASTEHTHIWKCIAELTHCNIFSR